jgi:hypothetical protein
MKAISLECRGLRISFPGQAPLEEHEVEQYHADKLAAETPTAFNKPICIYKISLTSSLN